jgi:uncharacterized protein (UPF0333 family)
MKRCPKCNRTYQDDNQKFCTVDGGRLDSVANAESNYNSPTVITNQADLNLPPHPPVPDLNKTMAVTPPPPTGEIRSGDTGPATNRTIAASFQPADFPPPPAPQPPPQTYQPTPDYQRQQPPPPPYQQQPQQQYQQQQYQPQPPAPSSGQLSHTPQAAAHPQSQAQHRAPAERKGSRLPLIIGALVVLLLAGAAAYYFLVFNKKDNATANANSNANVANANADTNTNANLSTNTNGNANTTVNANTNTAPPPYEPPPNTRQFVNSQADLSGKIAEHFVPFSFYYPNAWELNTAIASDGTYFVRADRKLPPNFVQERFTVGWYESKGTYDADKSLFPNLVTAASTNLAKLPGYEKLSEGPTKVNSMDAYAVNFKGFLENTDKGDITYWGRVIFLPPGVEGRKDGLQLTILTSSLAPELKGVEDVGVKGELPVILDSFRLK